MVKRYYPYVIIFFFAFLLFVPNLNNTTLFDWDEINFAEAAREMIVNGDYTRVTINYLPFWEKPPLFLWMQAVSMNTFGINEFSARLPNAIFGIISLITLFAIGKKYFGERMAWLWVVIYTGSFFAQFYFMMGMIDPVFNYFIFLGIYFLFRYSTEENTEIKSSAERIKLVSLSGVFVGLAVLTKGPVAFLIVFLCIAVYFVLKRKSFSLKVYEMLLFCFIVLIVSTAWFGIETIKNGFFFLQEFIVYQIRLFNTQDAGHGGPFYYHFVVILIGLFPASVFAIWGFKKISSDNVNQKNFHTWMVILFWVVMILFAIVKTKIVHYSSLAYFPVTFLAAYYLNNVITEKAKWKKWKDVLIIIMGSILTIIVVSLPIIFVYKDKWIDRISDRFTTDLIMKPVHWTGFETLAYALLIAGIIVFILVRKRKGFFTGLVFLFVIYTIGINLSLKFFAPKIDEHLQKDVVEFYKSLENKDVYCDVIGFKSYAHLFYTYKKNPENKNSLVHDWLLTGQIDKPVYFLCKSTYRDKMEKEHPEIKEVKQIGGYIVYLRDKH
jgi:4-amino-4-deoxy-L-arabinose transferase-like glycosyltransferase